VLDENKDDNRTSNNHNHHKRRRKAAVQAPFKPTQQGKTCRSTLSVCMVFLKELAVPLILIYRKLSEL